MYGDGAMLLRIFQGRKKAGNDSHKASTPTAEGKTQKPPDVNLSAIGPPSSKQMHSSALSCPGLDGRCFTLDIVSYVFHTITSYCYCLLQIQSSVCARVGTCLQYPIFLRR